jgi:hypothetical protein
MGVNKGEEDGDPAKQLVRMVCPGYKKSGMFSSKCKKCGMAKDAH